MSEITVNNEDKPITKIEYNQIIDDEEIKENKKNLSSLVEILIYLAPVAFLASDNILRIIFYIFLIERILKITKNHGPRYGRSSIKLGKAEDGKGNFLRLNTLLVLLTFNTGSMGLGDIASDIVVYTAKRSYTEKNETRRNILKTSLNVTFVFDDLVNNCIKFIAMTPKLPGWMDSIGDIRTRAIEAMETRVRKISDAETIKKHGERNGRIIIAANDVLEKVHTSKVFLEEEPEGVFKHFVWNNILRIFKALYSSIAFIISHFILSLIYFWFANDIARFFIKLGKAN